MPRLAPEWLGGCKVLDICSQPTFHKHVGALNSGVHIHAEGPWYDPAAFRPWRVQALGFKAIRSLYPDYPIWRGTDFKYEYTDDVQYELTATQAYRILELFGAQRTTPLLRGLTIETPLDEAIMATKPRSEEHTSELQSLMRISYAVFCLKKKKPYQTTYNTQ